MLLFAVVPPRILVFIPPMLPVLALRVLVLRVLAPPALPFGIVLVFMPVVVPVLLPIVPVLLFMLLSVVVVVVLVVPVLADVPVVDALLVEVVVVLLVLSLEQAAMNRPNAATTRRAKSRRIEFPPIVFRINLVKEQALALLWTACQGIRLSCL